jgi:Ca-activated chloride channel family protein
MLRMIGSYLLALGGAALPARACDLALLLAVDISGSVDPREYRIQMQGLADGLRDGVVSEALVRGQAKVAVMQWTGSTRQQITVTWSSMTTFADVEALAVRVETAPRAWRNYSTAVGEAMAVGLRLFEDVSPCRRKVMDISGDGEANEGMSTAAPRAALSHAGITVNGLAIDTNNEDLTGWYWENVITGAGAFVVTANDFSEYPRAIRLKLIRETSSPVALRQ